jgi:hypothetical protein
MNKIANLLIMLFALLAPSTHLFAQKEAEYQKLSKSYTLNADGSQEERVHMELALFSHAVIHNAYGESFIKYNPQYQKLTINESFTRQKDGTIVKTPSNAFVEMLPDEAADAPAYNMLREMVVVHTGLEIGATICLDYTITSQKGYLTELDVFEEIEKSSPVKDYTLSLSVPEGKTLNYTLHGLNTRPKESSAGGMKTLTWTMHNVKEASHEASSSVLCGDVPFLAASSYSSPQEALSRLFARFTPSSDVQLCAIAETLTEGKTSDTEKLQAILRHVVEEVDGCNVSLRDAGFRIRSVNDMFYSAYGTAAEKANLLHGLLSAAGIEAEPAAAYKAEAPTESLALRAISEIVVVAKADGREYVLSPTSDRMATAGWYRKMPLLSLSHAGQPLSLSPSDTHINYEVSVSVTEEKAESVVKASLGDAFLPYYGADAKPRGENDTITQPLKTNNGYLFLQLPDAPMGMARSQYCRLNTAREKNILLPYAPNEHFRYVISLPQGMRLASAVDSKVIENEAGKLTLSILKEGEKTIVERSLKLRKQQYSPREFASLRTLLTEWSESLTTPILISKE